MPKLPIWHKTGSFGKIHLSHFYLLIVPYHVAKLKKILEESDKFYKVEKCKDIEKQTQIYQGQ